MVYCEKVTDHNKWGSGHTWPPKLAGTDEQLSKKSKRKSQAKKSKPEQPDSEDPAPKRSKLVCSKCSKEYANKIWHQKHEEKCSVAKQ